MITGLDHIIIAVDDLTSASARLARQIGLVVVPGGTHPGWGTHNAVSWFGSEYLELIAVRDEAEAREHPRGQALIRARRAGEGLLGFALGCAGIDETVAAIRRRGLSVEDPQPGTRQRPDGTVIRWQTAVVAGDTWGHRLPFLIEHGSTPAERRRTAPPEGHPLGATGIAGVAIAVADLDTAIAEYQQLIGREPVVEDVPALPARRATFQIGDFALDLLAPLAVTGGLAEFVRERGEGIFLVSLAVPKIEDAVRILAARGTAVGQPTARRRAPLLDPAQTLGARFQLVERPQ